ncbi:autotransporter outer membrane beta-barrel domain-containing protein [Bartonella florencae]|uniref:autotransporter outer membrane beta-barrel domain-containing protein n=1 Tax=Bartonella florencae TaxID=928210 RepID=UPI0002DA001F|nr:autotransporter outer membrane beta-barrel domain-containing protein [Bartonella florencae]
MVNVFRGYKFLFITTAIVSFLPITNINANPNNLEALCNEARNFYRCSDGKKHTIKDKTYDFTSYKNTSSPYSILFLSPIDVEKKGTVIDASKITVLGGDRKNGVYAYAAYVKNGAQLILTDSNFINTLGFIVTDAVISMEKGGFQGDRRVVYASGKKADVALVNVNVEIEPSSLNVKEIAIFSVSGAFVRMSGSTVTSKGAGLFSTMLGGKYLLDSLVVKGEGKKEGSVGDNIFPEAFEVSQGGNVHLRDSSFQLTDMHGFLIKHFSGYGYNNGKLIQEYASSDEFKKTDISIERSEISVQGEKGYGFYFDGLDPVKWANILELTDDKRAETETILSGEVSVYLSDTTVSVPDGIAIYSTGDEGYGAEATIELIKTKISGDLLLSAENNSFLSVKANDSNLTGGIDVEGISRVDLELTRGSSWSLTKRKHVDLQQAFPVDSSLSSIKLSDSTICFEKFISKDYQTLYIGRVYIKKGGNINNIMSLDSVESDQEAYKAEGNVQIKMSAFVNNDGSFDPQKTDRILIYGNVSGTTLLVMENFSKTSEKKVDSEGSQSVSLIQVSGKAKEDSFKLSGNYTAINGLPYQYKLLAYGPDSSRGKADPQNRLVAGGRDFWDFRLETVYIDPNSNSPETISSSSLPEDTTSVLSDPMKPSSTAFEPTSFTPALPSPPAPPEMGEPSAPDPVLPSPPVPSEMEDPSFPDLMPPSPSAPSEMEAPSSPDLVSPSPSTPSEMGKPSSPDPATSSQSVPSEPVDPTPPTFEPTPFTPASLSPSAPSGMGKPSSPDPVPPSQPVPSEMGDPSSLDPVPPSPSESSGMVEPSSPNPASPSPSEPSGMVEPSSPDPVPPSPPSPSGMVELSSPNPASPSPSEPSGMGKPSSPDSVPSKPVKPTLPDSVSVKPDIQHETRIRAVVPQLPTYLLLPNALFQTGLMDLSVQNKKLESMRGTAAGLLKSDEISAFFVRSYGGSHHYVSNLSVLEYGYGADLEYTALEAGVLLKKIESLYSRTLFGVLGTYGNLSLYPQDVEYSKKSSFDKWSVAVYGNLQHDTGFYMNGVFSYGLFKGDVFTSVRDKVATLRGKQLNTSLTIGETFTIGYKGIIFDPQVQLLYQRLQFDRVHDVDNIDVDLGKFDQWTARFGGCLSKLLSSSEEGRVISFYSKLYLSYNFREKNVVSFKKDFQLGAFGSPLEVGLGFHARLSPKFALHGDVTYQHRLSKAGFSGASFSAGLRHLF